MNTKHLLIAALTWGCLTACTEKPVSTPIAYATFNIRMDTPADSTNSWIYRKDSVAQFIRKNHIDIAGLQEVLHHQLNDLMERLPEYAYVGVGREDGKTQGEYAPIIYKSARFEVLESNTFWLSQYPDSIGFIGWDGACTRIATWAKMKDKENGQTFLAVNTHFDHVGTEARRNAALLIIDRIKQIAGEYPAILSGDLNVPETWEAYQTITSNKFVLKDTYKTASEKSGPGYTFHDFGRIDKDSCEKIDYIFTTPQVKILRSDIAQENRDGKVYLSDHNPIITQIEL